MVTVDEVIKVSQDLINLSEEDAINRLKLFINHRKAGGVITELMRYEIEILVDMIFDFESGIDNNAMENEDMPN